MQKYIYDNFDNLIHWPLSKLHAERKMLCKLAYFTREWMGDFLYFAETSPMSTVSSRIFK